MRSRHLPGDALMQRGGIPDASFLDIVVTAYDKDPRVILKHLAGPHTSSVRIRQFNLRIIAV
jgi:hypothetical protein